MIDSLQLDRERGRTLTEPLSADKLMTRAEHLQWCKDRAMEYVANGDIAQAIASMSSDLGKHPETRNHLGIQLGVMMLCSGALRTQQQAREFIEGFN